MHKIINNLRGREIHGKDEAEYFESIVSHIHTKEDHTFVFSVWNEPLGDIPNGSIVFSTSDEYHQQPIADHLQKNVFLLFKNYYPTDSICDSRVFPFPLGYLTNFSGTDSIPINERELDYSFAGTFNGNGRDKMCRELEARKNDGKKKFCAITHSWGKGLSMDEYSKLLSHTKISLCPSGYVSKESFRIFEAARCGCILIVDDVPTNLWYYNEFPGIILKDWSDISIIERLLSDPDKMQDISNKTIRWYERCISPKSVASYVQSKIEEKTT
jgi:glycosyltransferase involved in cell wall biosynthesis